MDKHEDVIDSVIHYLKENEGAPVTYKNMEKPLSKDITPDYVKEKLLSDLNDDSFEFLIKWENNTSNEVSRFTNDFSKVISEEATAINISWGNSLKNILSKLACSYTGTDIIDDSFSLEATSYATRVLNQSLSEDLKVNIDINLELPQKTNVTLKNIAKLNSILFVEKVKDNIIDNGKVFIEDDDDFHNLLRNKILIKRNSENIETRLVSVILTPSCDLAHKKILADNSSEYHRILMGLMIVLHDDLDSCFEYNASSQSNKKRVDDIISLDKSFSEKIKDCLSTNNHGLESSLVKKELENINKKIKILQNLETKIQHCISGNKPDNLYITQPFMDRDNKISVFVFHFGTVQTKKINPANISFSYLMKNSLISDLQTKLANHVNRLGNSMLEFKQ